MAGPGGRSGVAATSALPADGQPTAEPCVVANTVPAHTMQDSGGSKAHLALSRTIKMREWLGDGDMYVRSDIDVALISTTCPAWLSLKLKQAC